MNHTFPIDPGAFQTLFIYIERQSEETLSAIDKALIFDSYQQLYLKRDQFFLQEGAIDSSFAFIVSGALRLYSKDEKGQEHTIKLAVETCWIGDYESFRDHKPSRFYIEAVEDAQLFIVTREQFDLLILNVPAYRKMIERLNHCGLIANHKRIEAAISMSSEERYQDLLKSHPEFFERFTDTMIASYLGITPDTLHGHRQSVKTG